MKKLLFTTLSVGLLAASANAAVTPKTPDVVNGCYQIGTVEELYGFAAVVNGTNGQTANKAACGKLTADIKANESNVHVSEGGNLIAKECSKTGMMGACTQYADRPLESWTPIKGFSGVFDGGNHTISSLYYIAPSTSEAVNVDAGFFASVAGGAVIKNLNIRDSYFRALNRIGGIVADIQAVNTDKMVVIDNCSFGGTVAGGVKTLAILPDTHGNNIGGLVGSVGQNVKLTISNSYNTGRVLSSNLNDNTGVETEIAGAHFGGLVGLLQSEADVKIYNSYNTGYVGGDKSFMGIQYGPYSALVARSNGEPTPAYDGVYCSNENKGAVTDCAATSANYKAAADIPTAYAAYDQSKIQAIYSADADVLGKMLALDPNYVHMDGVSISYDDGVVATITDASETFSIPQDIKVSKVVFNRVLKNNTSSTMALPFDIAASEVSGASFYEPINVVRRANDDGRDTVEAQAVSNVVAYKSYVVIPDADGSLVVDGAVVLKKTEGTSLVNDFTDHWQFINPIEMKRWDIVGSVKYPEGNNADEIGRVYGFAGANTTGAELGSFVRVATNVAIKPMRGYLMYTGELPEGCKNALCKSSAAVQMPESIVLRIVEPVVPSDEEQVTLEEGTTALQGMRQVPMAKTDRWFDLKGRSLNKKPASKGVFINNRKPIIVK